MVVFKCAYELDEIHLAQVYYHSLPKILLAASAETASGSGTAKENHQNCSLEQCLIYCFANTFEVTDFA